MLAEIKGQSRLLELYGKALQDLELEPKELARILLAATRCIQGAFVRKELRVIFMAERRRGRELLLKLSYGKELLTLEELWG